MAESGLGGRFVWYDLMTSDTDGAAGFYKDVVGWGTQPWEQAEPPYTMWTVGEAPIGGLMGLPPGLEAPPHWIGYVQVDDVDATTAKAEELGGGVMKEPTDIPTVGRFAVLTDPQGAVFAVFKPTDDADMDDHETKPGEFAWHELMTTDHGSAFDFYSALFGWSKMDSFDMGEMGMYEMYGAGDRMLGGMFTKPADQPGPSTWLYYTNVGDLDGAVERVKAGGGQILNGPMEVPGGDRIAQCMDPQGGMFALHERAAQH